MFDLRRAPVARILLPFAGGSLAGGQQLFPVPIWEAVVASVTLWTFLILIYLKINKNPGYPGWLFGSVGCFLFMIVGYATGQMMKPQNPLLPTGKLLIIRGEVLEDPSQGDRSWHLDMCLTSVITEDTSMVVRSNLKIYLDLPVDSVWPASGEIWQFAGTLSPIMNSGNKGAPDYEAIMQRKDYWYRFFTVDRSPLNHRVEEQNRKGIRAVNLRNEISGAWRGAPEEISLLRAVCLGDRSTLTDDMRQSFSGAGGMHLLAVSGLHVGLIWWVLYHSLSWLVRWTRREYIRGLILIGMLWIYASVTGFSSSVCRSVTMFTLYTLARMIDQQTHPVNAILVSAFVLMCLNPLKLLEVGFQLSYAAVLGIVTLYPHLRKLIPVKHTLLKWIRDATLVSVAAQLATAPLVIYYFHQWPLYSLLTNLIAIPLLSAIITLFMLSVPFMATGVLTGVFNGLLMVTSRLMNRLMECIASLPGSVIGELSMEKTTLFLILTIIFLVIVILNIKSSFPRYMLLLAMVVTLGWTSLTRYRELYSAELVVGHFRGGSLITFREGYQVDHYIWSSDSLTTAAMKQYMGSVWSPHQYQVQVCQVSDSSRCMGSVSHCIQLSQGVCKLGNDRVSGWVIAGQSDRRYGSHLLPLLLDPSKHFYRKSDFILLSQEPALYNVVRSFASFPGVLIVDGSNRPWYTRRIEISGNPVHYTRQRGAYLKRW